MIVEYIRYTLVAHSAKDLIDAYMEASKHLAAAPECIDYELSQCTDDAQCVVLRICWRSTEDHMKGFRSGPNFPPFLAAIRDFIPEITEMRHYALTQVVGAGLGRK